MREHYATTPFGRRPVTFGQIAARLRTEEAVEDAVAEAGRPGANRPAAAHKWKLFRALTEAKAEIGVSDRALGVLNALLSFHPETALSLPDREEVGASDGDGEGEGGDTSLIVFPSNRELSLRAHGIGERSLARHLASLVAAGLILRRDSPNGKRYARRARKGEGFSEAFGFDLTPLVARAAEFEEIAERLRRERQRMRVLREKISLHRRDISKLIACGLDENIPGDWEGFSRALLGFSGPLRRVHDLASMTALEDELGALHGAVAAVIESHIHLAERSAGEKKTESEKESGNAGQSDSHHHNSNTQSQNLEPASTEARGNHAAYPEKGNSPAQSENLSRAGTPLGMVLDACPDIRDWAPDGLRNWADFLAAARLARSALGISPNAWAEAIDAMGEIDAAISVAAILQRHESSSDAVATPSPDGGPPRTTVHGSPAIVSAGGYLRALTEKARAGEFAVAPILIATIAQRRKSGRPAPMRR